jgi:hypothetical protein
LRAPAQAGRQAPKRGRPPLPSFLAFGLRSTKADDLAPLAAVAAQPAAARFTVRAAAAVPFALRALLPPRGCDAAAARLVTLRAEGPCVHVPSYQGPFEEANCVVEAGAPFPAGQKDALDLELVALPLLGKDGSGAPLLRQLFLLLAAPPEEEGECPMWARTPRDAPAWLSATDAGRGPVYPACDGRKTPSGWEAFDAFFDAPPPAAAAETRDAAASA